MISESTRFYRETLPAQWNQSLEEQIDRSRSGDEQSRILEDMRRVDASIQVVVDGAGGGRHALNVSAGRMEAAVLQFGIAVPIALHSIGLGVGHITSLVAVDAEAL